MRNEDPNRLDRYVHVIRYDREKQRVILMIDGCEYEQCEPIQRFKERYTRVK
ncbi:hypothetical protein DR95_1183 [Proteus vulgaris]|uniref:DUF4222 domain-containing protein n=1 Tax=Proteus TaxID=583 RepID=UPI0004FFB2DD|nr:DUF4222 domain-containing protein [Proteus vulgaris]KGA59678.1 hypothetical protein DR95_1183 [Proteus vulgaris]